MKRKIVITDLIEIDKISKVKPILGDVSFYTPDSYKEILSDSYDGFYLIILYLGDDFNLSKVQEIVNFIQRIGNSFKKLILRSNKQVNLELYTQETELFFTSIPVESETRNIFQTFLTCFSYLDLESENLNLQKKLFLSSFEISKLTKIGISIGEEKNISKLLEYILSGAREMAFADSGSLYLVERDEKGVPRNLRFKISALNLDTDEFILPIDNSSISGYVANTGKVLNILDAYNLPENVEYKFNSNYDVLTNYHCKSMLVVPMKNHRDEIIGVIQLINKKKEFRKKLTIEDMKGEEVVPFDDYTSQLVMSIAGQAAVAIQNNLLIREIENLFEGFVTASVKAIESRDPTTSGHSFRVASMTTALALVMNKVQTGIYKDLKFSEKQIKEIRYASLLHDFGKVGVREKILTKAKKLDSLEVDLIQWRFAFIKKDLEVKIAQKKIEYLKKHGSIGFADFEKSLNLELSLEINKLDSMIQIIESANEPAVILDDSNSSSLDEISKISHTTTNQKNIPLLSEYEFNMLLIKKGSLDFRERKEIESHVEHTFQFLAKIPWTSDLKMVPNIAHSHHEKINGAGYPRGLTGDQIPPQAKMMAISDIYDALTDKDRPYKRALSVEHALDILVDESKKNHIDGELLRIFMEGKVFEKANIEEF